MEYIGFNIFLLAFNFFFFRKFYLWKKKEKERNKKQPKNI